MWNSSDRTAIGSRCQGCSNTDSLTLNRLQFLMLSLKKNPPAVLIFRIIWQMHPLHRKKFDKSHNLMQLVVAPTAAQQIKKWTLARACSRDLAVMFLLQKAEFYFVFCCFRTKEPGYLCPTKLFARRTVLSRRNRFARPQKKQASRLVNRGLGCSDNRAFALRCRLKSGWEMAVRNWDAAGRSQGEGHTSS